VPPSLFRHSRATLTEHGNIAAATVLDALRRLFAEDLLVDGARGMIAGFGPGITAEMALGTWKPGLASPDCETELKREAVAV
jgi:1,3,6,8-tetrahydroxynaphthalene synthase